MITGTSWAGTGELKAVKGQIAGKGAKWMAGDTTVSRLLPAERTRLLGALPPVVAPHHRFAEKEKKGGKGIMELPASLDWRSYGGASYVTPVRNQGSCGSCWAFAATAALESQALIDGNAPGTDVNLAEQTLVSCSGAGSCSGGYIDSAADYIRDTGIPPEGCFPYTGTTSACSNACPTTLHSITGWLWVTTWSPTVEALKNGLATYGPLITTMDVYTDFYYYKSGVYSYTSGSYEGGHAVLIVGFSDDGQYFIVKNSWGTGWGEAGYFRIAYSELAGLAQFGGYSIAYDRYEGPTAPPPCTYAVSPTSASYAAAAATGTVSVTAAAGCTWTAKANVTWIRVTAGASGTGPGSVTYSVAKNTAKNARTGTLTIAGQTVTVTQAGTRTKTR